MSNLTIRFYSNCLRRYTTFKMYLPCDIRQDWGQTDTKYSENSTKTLFLLHGFTGDAENWVPEYLSDKYNFAVVIPSGENSFWLDGRSTGHQFCKFVGEELVDYVRRVFRLAKDGSETYIMGLSMGGFGALHTAFAYPETFGKVAALSSALIVHEVAGMSEGQGNGVNMYNSVYSQAKMGKAVSLKNIEAGDLIICNNYGHVAMYIGGGKIVHAMSTYYGIRIQPLANIKYCGKINTIRRIL